LGGGDKTFTLLKQRAKNGKKHVDRGGVESGLGGGRQGQVTAPLLFVHPRTWWVVAKGVGVRILFISKQHE